MGQISKHRASSRGSKPQITVRRRTPLHPTLPKSPFSFPKDHIPWGNPTKSHVQISFSQEAYKQIMRHTRSNLSQEVGGLLLGQAYQADGNYYHVVVKRALPDYLGQSSSMTFAFTEASWAALVKQTETEYPSERIIGWYHSHPDFGIFYSGTDKKSHRTYFNTPWRIGLVVDPIRQEGGFFALARGNGDAEPLPGFFEQLDRNRRSIISWRNWGTVSETASSLPDDPISEPVDGIPEPSPAEESLAEPISQGSEQSKRKWLDSSPLLVVTALALIIQFVLFLLVLQRQNHQILLLQHEVETLRSSVITGEALPTPPSTEAILASNTGLDFPDLTTIVLVFISFLLVLLLWQIRGLTNKIAK